MKLFKIKKIGTPTIAINKPKLDLNLTNYKNFFIQKQHDYQAIDINEDDFVYSIKYQHYIIKLFNDYFTKYRAEEKLFDRKAIYIKNPFPLQSFDYIQEFVKYLVFHEYAYNTISDYSYMVIRYDKLQYNRENAITKVYHENLRKILKRVIKKIPRTTGKSPCRYTDILTFLAIIPFLYKHIEEDVSKFLFMLYTGSRMVSVRDILIEDIIRFIKNPENNNYIITINVNRTKGTLKYGNDSKTFDGNPSLEFDSNNITTDFIYWLNLHLILNFNLNLLDYPKWNMKNIGKKYLWRHTKTQYIEPTTDGIMRHRFKKFFGIEEFQLNGIRFFNISD